MRHTLVAPTFEGHDRGNRFVSASLYVGQFPRLVEEQLLGPQSRHRASNGPPALRRPGAEYLAMPTDVVGVTILRGVLDSLWSAATRHPFLEAVREGTITDSAFDRWLVQDALFVGDLLTFQARLLARAPRTAQTVLASGCVALVAELDWFEDQAARRGMKLEQPALPATLAYRELLGRLDATPYEAAVTALWVIERVYLLAWAFAASATSPFGEFIEHWSAPAFADYVDALGVLAIPDRHDTLVADVLAHEVAFWDMALA
jgi:thiaminase